MRMDSSSRKQATRSSTARWLGTLASQKGEAFFVSEGASLIRKHSDFSVSSEKIRRQCGGLAKAGVANSGLAGRIILLCTVPVGVRKQTPRPQ